MKRTFFLVLFVILGSPLRAAEPLFDEFLDTFAADWMRGNPQAATAS